MAFDYLRDPTAIYRQSFATIRDEADLSGLSDDEAVVAFGCPRVVETNR